MLQRQQRRFGRENFDIDQVYREISTVKDWFSSLNLREQRNIISESLNVLAEFERANTERRLDEFLTTRAIKEVFHCSENLRSFIRIYRSLSRHDPSQLPKGKLKEILEMPLIPHDEVRGSDNVHPRNTLFELEFAARVIKSGYSIFEFDDSNFILDGQRIFVECKRLHSRSRVKDNLQKALEQIQARAIRPSDRGIVVISYDKTTQVEETVYTASREEQLVNRGESIFQDFYNRYSNCFDRFYGTPVVGVLLTVKYVSTTTGTGDLNPNFNHSFFRTVHDYRHMEPDRILFQKLMDTLDVS